MKHSPFTSITLTLLIFFIPISPSSKSCPLFTASKEEKLKAAKQKHEDEITAFFRQLVAYQTPAPFLHSQLPKNRSRREFELDKDIHMCAKSIENLSFGFDPVTRKGEEIDSEAISENYKALTRMIKATSNPNRYNSILQKVGRIIKPTAILP